MFIKNLITAASEAESLAKEVRRNTEFENEAQRSQLGFGIYTSPSPGEYLTNMPGQTLSSNRYCVFYMDKALFKGIYSAWISETYEGSQLWETPEATIAKYVADDSGVDKENAQQTLRLSPFNNKPLEVADADPDLPRQQPRRPHHGEVRREGGRPAN
ncbi:Uu.00g000220.m01.CDS01 [Anthostomella pinea]|uniref:Uu.00g000220.m01.CDS01 n=1 Tax=Anthostomella pinea TaxID=933095 RepID=A0AAI8VJ84_9PEZI|nr:Uu.00g000220.m01.CDS01 [Anthostomella pinea]